MDYNEKLHTPSSEPFFYDTAYVLPNRCNAIPVNEKGVCGKRLRVCWAKKQISGLEMQRKVQGIVQSRKEND